MKLIVTIDVEEDASPDWSSGSIPAFRGVTDGLKNILQPLFQSLGVRPTLLISPIVLQDIASVEVMGQLDNVELGAHLHWEQIAPHPERTLQGGILLPRHMQWDHPPETERDKLETLTELFCQQFGSRPTSFRAGRYGASRSTGAILKQLGYEVDTSATPHIKWQTPGNQVVDYSDTPEQPYYIADPGNILKPGNFDLLEVPITILAKDKIPGLTAAPWFRPGYSTPATFKEMVRIVRERNCAGTEQPLVMMFHNVEVIPGASPYTKTPDDVRAYLDDLRAALDYAIGAGFEPCTLTDYARTFKQNIERARQLKHAYEQNIAEGKTIENGIGIPFEEVRRAIDRQGGITPWHRYIYKDRNTRWDVLAISSWVANNLPKIAAILSVGCGMGFNLYWWARLGYTDLSGFDRNENTIAASNELISRYNLPIHLWSARVENADHSFCERFDYIEAMDCLMYEEGMYRRFLKSYSVALKSGGYMALDTIDPSYNSMPNNQWSMNSLHKPILDREPNEYKVRLSEKQIVTMASQHGLALVTSIKNPAETLPRVIYIFRKELVSCSTNQHNPQEQKVTSDSKGKLTFDVL